MVTRKFVTGCDGVTKSIFSVELLVTDSISPDEVVFISGSKVVGRLINVGS